MTKSMAISYGEKGSEEKNNHGNVGWKAWVLNG